MLTTALHSSENFSKVQAAPNWEYLDLSQFSFHQREAGLLQSGNGEVSAGNYQISGEANAQIAVDATLISFFVLGLRRLLKFIYE